MKRLLALFTLVLVVLSQMVLGVSCQKRPAPFLMPSVPPTIQALTYTNSEYGFSLNCPADWDVKEGWKETLVTFMGPVVLKGTDYQYPVNILVAAEQLPEDITLKDYLLLTINAQKATGLTTFTFSHGTISGLPAEIAVISGAIKVGKEKIALKDILAVLIKDNIGYVLAYDVPVEFHDKYLDAFELAITTFRFDKEASPALTLNIGNVELCSAVYGGRDYKIQPDATFNRGEEVWLYFEVYGMKSKAADGKWECWVKLSELKLYGPDGNMLLYETDGAEVHDTAANEAPDYTWFEAHVQSPRDGEVGQYRFEFTVTDVLSGAKGTGSATFTLK